MSAGFNDIEVKGHEEPLVSLAFLGGSGSGSLDPLANRHRGWSIVGISGSRRAVFPAFMKASEGKRL